MSVLSEKINYKLSVINEQSSAELKNPSNPEFDRQYSEDMLFHTIGPLTDNPRWTSQWTSPSEPPEDFRPDGPAPRWTEEELVFAFAGDPSLLETYSSGNPRSPRYGRRGGAPLFRLAKKVARHYSRPDNSFIADLYSNGFIALTRLMQPGMDQSIKPFISYAMAYVRGAMQNGIGGEKRTTDAARFENELGQKGLRSILDEVDPYKIRKAAQIVQGKYREQSLGDKDDKNPFGIFSAPYYKVTNAYADALESGSESDIALAREDIEALIDKINDYNRMIGGASTGLGQAIDTPDRKTSIGVASLDKPSDDEGGATLGSTIAGSLESSMDPDEIDLETINFILGIALEHNLGAVLANSEKYNAMAVELGAYGGKIGGRMSAVEFRYILRSLGPAGSSYPGKGKIRENLSIPRDARGWWQPGEDPELEPIPNTEGTWKSKWMRSGYQAMGPLAISDEMTNELREFSILGIKTAREVKIKENGRREAVSKVSVARALQNAIVKLKIISDIYSDQLGVKSESIQRSLPEDLVFDDIDRSIIVETTKKLITRINRSIVLEKSPPGWKGTTKAMKKHKDIDNPFALAWHMKKKGDKPHYKDKEGKPEKKKQYEDIMKPVDSIII